MIFSTKKLKLVSLFLLTAACSFGQSNTSALLPLPNHIEQVTGKKNFTITPQTTVKTNLPKQAFCLFELQRILRNRVGQPAIMGGFTASGNSLIELSTDPGIKGKEHYILDISENKVSIKGATQDALFYG